MSRNRKEMSRQEEEEEGGPGETFPSIAPKRRFCHFFSGGSPNLLAHDAARRGPVAGGGDGLGAKACLPGRCGGSSPALGWAQSMAVAGAGRLGGSIYQ
jgi:hypothetical protein